MAIEGTPAPGRSVASKVMAILGAFSTSRRELSLNELARATGFPLSTTYRLASELVRWGGLAHVAGGGYRLGARIREIGSMASGGGLYETAAPLMQDLAQATHESVELVVLDGQQALVIADVIGPGPGRVETRRGGRSPLHATAAGKVLLAHAPADLVAAVLGAVLTRYTPHTVVAPGDLRRALTDVRHTGLAFARGELAVGMSSVASPVLDASGGAVAALSISIAAARGGLQRLAPAVRTAALCTSRHLRSSLSRFPGHPS